MGFELTGVSSPLGGISWTHTTSAKEISRQVLDVLSDRRLLQNHRGHSPEDPRYCVLSALQLRQVLTDALKDAKNGSTLETELKAMRGAFTGFVDTAGPDGRNLQDHAAMEAARLELIRTVNDSVVRVAERYRLTNPLG
jgi:hypothetical protein